MYKTLRECIKLKNFYPRPWHRGNYRNRNREKAELLLGKRKISWKLFNEQYQTKKEKCNRVYI